MKRYKISNGKGYLTYYGLDEVCAALQQCGPGRDWPELDGMSTKETERLQGIRNNPRIDRIDNFARQFGLYVCPV
jgi:hypothetical protein